MKLIGAKTREPSRTLSARILNGTENVAGIYDEIIHGHPDALKGALSMRVRFAGTPLRLVPAPDEDDVERAFRERCERIVGSLIYDLRKSTNISDAIEHLSDAIIFGAAVYEVTWTRDAYDYPVVNLSPIPLQNITRWEEVGGRAVPVVMVDNRPITVPAERLIHIVPATSAGPNGIGILRSLVLPYELWKQTLIDIGIRSGKEAGGVIVQSSSAAVDDAQVRSVVENAAEFASGQVAAWVVPYGYSAEVADLPLASSKMDVVEYCDQKIRAMFDDALSSLVSSSKGSRALGDAVSESADNDEVQTIEYLVGRFGRALFAHVALAYEYNGRAPTLTGDPETKADLMAVVQTAQNAALLTGWYTADRDSLRESLGMPAIEHAGSEIQLGPETSLMMSRKKSDDGQVPDIVDTPSLIAGRVADEERLQSTIEALVASLREDAIRAMEDGVLTQVERAVLENTHMRAIEGTILGYADRRRQKAAAWGIRLRDRAAAEGLVGEAAKETDALKEGLSASLLSAAMRVDDMAAAQARTIFQRVVGEVEEQYTSRGGDLGTTPPETRITAKGLAEGAAGVGHAAEQAGRLEGAAEAAEQSGMVLVGAWRASFEDSNRCSVCRGKSQTYHEASNLPDLPDPECKGGVARCRCGLVPVFAKEKK